MVAMVYMYGESSLTGTFPYMRVERTESGLTSSKIKIIKKKKMRFKKVFGERIPVIILFY